MMTSRRVAARRRRLLTSVMVIAGLVVGGTVVAMVWDSPERVDEACRAKVGPYAADLTLVQAENASLIAALAVQRGMPARAATIALAAAYQESDLENLDYGDRDSVGLFQQRPSQGWGSVEEIMDPYYATEKFYEALEEIPGYPEMEINDAAQRVQISAYPEAYGQHEPRARALASSLTGQSPATFSCTLDPERTTTVEPIPIRFAAEFARAFGVVEVHEVVDASMEIDVPDPTYGWAIAQWAVANATRFGVAAVAYDAKVWSVEDSPDGWLEDKKAPVNDNATGDGTAADPVRITFLS